MGLSKTMFGRITGSKTGQSGTSVCALARENHVCAFLVRQGRSLFACGLCFWGRCMCARVRAQLCGRACVRLQVHGECESRSSESML